jgi:transglutaminase-like putative cysteine protease
MYYAVKHETSFRYSAPINESVMEVYMQPRTEGIQRCLRFKLLTTPRARVFERYDALGNGVHFFDIPAQHDNLTIAAESVVELVDPAPLPQALGHDSWQVLDEMTSRGDFWDMLAPSLRTQPTALLNQFALELDVRRRDDPLILLQELNAAVYESFAYSSSTTEVDSPIDVALEARKGVCQDFTHILIALVRGIGIPCRYVSGYLFYRGGDRSVPDATHAWVEAYLPEIGWVGFDPTNNVLAGERHIRVAVGRDYNDVPPTRGFFKGIAETELAVDVEITPAETPFAVEKLLPLSGWMPETEEHQSQQQ